eukprot:TRINITY_DN4659_c0_g4_i1.p1 TRINITY_DN4659_c0_g4~~TRINITY_DN4659_c0_g4_i1.p1  ORF type:complete len:164 (+),score=43.71 TRINITY_DN4659_c0_g4_i1:684-1175(+)
MAKFLVVIDCAPTAKAALLHVASKAGNGDKITVLSIYTPPGIGAALVPSFDSGYMKHQKQISVEEQRKHAARKLLYKAKEILETSLKSNGKTVQVDYLSKKSGNKKKEVLKVASTVGATNIVLGSPSDQVELYTDEETANAAKYLSLAKLSKDLSSRSDVTVV